jgi:SAM-dependent methyltransferase
MSTDSFWNTFGTFMWVRYFNCKDLCRTIFRYWRKPTFALIDLSLLLSYFFKSPYRIAREFNDTEPYGETPLATLDAICKACPVGPSDVAYELGSGRGRSCFWLALFTGCKTVGIEYNPTFVSRAERLATAFRITNVEFRLSDILEADFDDASWIYLFGTALSEETIIKLAKRMEALKAGTKIITISYAISEYYKTKKIVLLKSLDVQFAWGTTQAYIHEIKC